MESFSDFDTLPPGFRFHPTDEELITHYLSHKVKDGTFCSKAIGEVDLNRVEPWDLPWEMKTSENECYYFCLRDRKYPNGMRTNRATGAGYWKATGKDREIFRASKTKTLVGMKKTLVFYKGRAPRGEKTNWVMHEFRLEGKHSLYDKNEWVICRIFIKGSGGETVDNMTGDLPPLKDVSASGSEGLPHVTCFSNSTAGVGDALLEDPAAWDSFVFGHLPPIFAKDSDPNSVASSQLIPGDLSVQEVGFMARDDHDFADEVYGSVDFDCLWN